MKDDATRAARRRAPQQIIDGRIADLCATGILGRALIVPRFVLGEFANVGGTRMCDPIKRERGRRGLEILNQLQQRALKSN